MTELGDTGDFLSRYGEGVTHQFFIAEEMGSFVERKIFKCTYIYMSHQTLLSCLNCIILISVFFTNGIFYFGPFYLTACETTPSWQNCSRKQYIYDSVVILH